MLLNRLIRNVFAAVPAAGIGVGTPSLVSKDDTTTQAFTITTLFHNVVDVVALVAGIIAFIYLIYSGILYLTAAGNPDGAKKGQQGILYAVIGIIIIVAAWAIINAISGTTNEQLLQTTP